MILQELYHYYERKAKLGEIALEGWIKKELDFFFVLNENGECVAIEPLDDGEGNGKPYLVPCIGKQASKHTNSGIDANLLWDKSAFALGVDQDEKKREKKLGSFIKALQAYFPDAQNSTISAILIFLSTCRTSKDHISQLVEKYLSNNIEKERILSGEPNISFRITGNPSPVFEDSTIVGLYEQYGKQNESKPSYIGVCLVSGLSNQPIEDKHLVIKGVKGAQSSGAAIVSFNKDAFCSYKKRGKDKNGQELSGYNAPVSKKAVDAYTKALNHMLEHDNHVSVGKATFAFWAEQKHEFEQVFPLFMETPKDEPDKEVRAVKQLYESITSGKLSTENQTRFFVLGLAPNDARLSVQYWRTGTVKDFAENLKQHFDDLNIVRGNNDDEYFSLQQLLSHVAFNHKISELPPNLSTNVVKAVLDGTPYPVSLLHGCIRRIRAEQAKKFNNRLVQNVSYIRAAILKACINRFNRFHHKTEQEEITMSLDKNNLNPAYRLGRLFAVLERIQANALNIETIRERYYGAASSTPVSVFPKLLKLKNHHLAKLDERNQTFFEKLIGEILDGLDGSGDMPRQLSLNDQARFAIGYYHQRQDLFKKPTANQATNETTTN